MRGTVLVGADGVRSVVRQQKFGDPHRYVGIVIVLGVSTYQHPLLHEQGFYTVDGVHRLFTMPYEPLATPAEPDEAAPPADATEAQQRHDAQTGAPHSTMWQLSFAEPDEAAARALCAQGDGAALLAEVGRRCADWHSPVPAMLAATCGSSVWGTLLVDRAAMPLRKKQRDSGPSPSSSRVTLVGDAAHCMTPFKGQGANQSLADAPLLAKHLAPALRGLKGGGTVANALARSEREMAHRAEAKVVASREAAGLYHSEAALDTSQYGVEGVPPERLQELLEAYTKEGVTAECGGALEARALEVFELLVGV